MAYIGNVPAEKYIALTQQTFSSPTGTSFTLSQAVTNPVDIDLYIDNVKQDPASYSVSGTSLTTSTVASPSTMYCIFNGKAMQTVNPPDDSVGLSQIASGTDGNLITFDASGNPAYVATGNDGQVLTSAGAGAAPAFETLSAGKILAVTQSVKTDTASTTSTSAASTGLEVTTGTLSSGSKVLVQVSAQIGNSAAEQRSHITLWNGSTQLFLGDSGTGHQVSAFARSMDTSSIYNISFMYLHDPSATSAQTYTLKYHRSTNTSYTIYINRGHSEDANSGRCASSITAMEVGA